MSGEAAVDMGTKLRGNVTSFDGSLLSGWASDGTKNPVKLRLSVNGVFFCELFANEPRDDVAAFSASAAGCGFSIVIPQALLVGGVFELALADCRSGVPISGSPYHIDASALNSTAQVTPTLHNFSRQVGDAIERAIDAKQLQDNMVVLLQWLEINVDRIHQIKERDDEEFK